MAFGRLLGDGTPELFLQVVDNEVTVLATEAEAGSDIDVQTAQEDLQRLLGEVPDSGLSVEEREEWGRRIAAARARVRIAGRGAE